MAIVLPSHVLLPTRPTALLSSRPVLPRQAPPPGSSAASRTARICGGARLFGLGVVCAFTKASNTRAVLLLRLVTQTLADWLSVTVCVTNLSNNTARVLLAFVNA